jgi:hypothetical protein
MADSLARAVVEFAASTDQFNAAIDQTVTRLSGMSKTGKADLEQLAKAAEQPATGFKSIVTALGPIPGMIGAAFSVQAIIGYAREIGEFAGHMVDLSADTQISTDRLQAWNYFLAGAGLTIDDFTQAAQQLQRRLGDGDDSAAGALRRLGLSVADLIQMTPDQAFILIAEAVAQIPNQAERAALMFELFGKNGSRMLRLVSDDLGDTIKQIQHSGAVIDDSLIRKADDFADAWGQAWIKFRAEALASIALMTGFGVGAGFGNPQGPKPPTAFDPNAGGGVTPVKPPTKEEIQAFDDQAAAIKKNVAAYEQHQKALHDLAEELSGQKTINEIKDLQTAYLSLTPTQRANTDTIKDVLDQYAKLEVRVGTGVVPVLDQLYQQYFKLTAQSKDVAEAMDKIAESAIKANQKTIEENAKFAAQQNEERLKESKQIIDSITATSDLQSQTALKRRDDDYASAEWSIRQAQREGASKQDVARMEAELSLSRLNASIADADAEFQHKAETLDRTTTYGEQQYQALADAHAEQVQRMQDDWQRGQQAQVESTQVAWTATIDELAKSFAQLSQIAGGCFSDIVKGIGTVIGSFDLASKGLTTFEGGLVKMTSGDGLKSIMSGIGGMVTGIGGIASAAMAAFQGIKALIDAFKSEETRKVNKPRDEFQNQFGGYGGLASALTDALASLGEEDAGNKAGALLRAMNDADTEDKWKAAEQAIADIFKRAGRDVKMFADGGIATRATLGVFGEAGPEAVLPLDRLSSLIGTSKETEQHITMMLDGQVLARSVVRNMPRQLHLAGVGAF